MSTSHQRFLIDGIFPAEEVHILGGPSGSGKTRLAFQLMRTWLRGEDFHGHACTKVPIVYISCDRSRASVLRVLDDLSIPHDLLPVYSGVDESLDNVEATIRKIQEKHPDVQVIFVDGFLSLLPGGKINEYGAVAKWLKEMTRLCKKIHITIIGIVHTTKTKEGEGYLAPREQLMGSVAFGGFADSILLLRPMDAAELTTQRRRLWLLPRSGKAEIYEYEFNNKGELIEVPPLPSEDPSSRIKTFIFALPKGTCFTFDEVAGVSKVAKSTVHRVLGVLTRSGLIERCGKGEYVVLRDFGTQNLFPASPVAGGAEN